MFDIANVFNTSHILSSHRNYAINDNDCCFLPSCTEEVEDILDMATTDEDDNWYKEVEKSLKESCHLTLHVVNVKEFQVMSLLDKTSFGEFGGPDFSGDADMSVCGYGYDLPNLYGVPPKRSPYYRNFSDSDFPSSGYDEEPPKGMGFKLVEELISRFSTMPRREMQKIPMILMILTEHSVEKM